MTCSRRKFITIAAGTVAMAAGCGRSVQTIDGVRYGMVHDETACIGCTACEEACREVNHIPETNDPKVTRLRIERTGPVGDYPNMRYYFYRHSCQHCENAPCVEVCPTGASYIDPATGIVDINPSRCVGCKYCVFACPYRVRFIHPVTRVIDKCDFCRHTNLKEGKLPACVLACPTKALTFGNLDNPDSEVSRKIRDNTYYRAKEALGTRPKMYRIPKGRIRS